MSTAEHTDKGILHRIKMKTMRFIINLYFNNRLRKIKPLTRHEFLSNTGQQKIYFVV